MVFEFFADASHNGLPEKIESAYGWIIPLGGRYQPGANNVTMPVDLANGRMKLSLLHLPFPQKRLFS